MPETPVWNITEPFYYRTYRPGGKGGYGHVSGPWHRAIRLTRFGYEVACGGQTEGYKHKYATRTTPPGKNDPYGLCPTCWPKEG